MQLQRNQQMKKMTSTLRISGAKNTMVIYIFSKIKKKAIIFFILFIAGCSFHLNKENHAENKLGGIILENPFIEHDTIWKDEIFIKGIATVKKNITLTILPGTKIKFIKIDLNNDKIGDGELIVEGKIIAKGEASQPIIFTSAETTPAKKDWTYVYLERNQGFVIENCIFSYAFTGLQIHYSEGKISNNLFEENHEGLRYSTVKILIRNNTFMHNNYGIRFEGRHSDADIMFNEITLNEYGVFAVMRCDKNGDRFLNNNIYNNLKYDFIMGIEQTDDIVISNNWLGSDDENEIEKHIYDKIDDAAVGVIKFIPFLKTKIENAGRKL